LKKQRIEQTLLFKRLKDTLLVKGMII